MVIHPLTPTTENGELTLAARIEWEKTPNHFPGTLWFKVPEAHAHLVSEYADGFVIALLSPALCRGEDIHLRASLSSALAHGLKDYTFIQTLRLPQRYKPIEISADSYEPREACATKAASSFSGGVDSFYTVWSHAPLNEEFAGNAIAYAFLVKGFDIRLDDTQTFDELCRRYTMLLKQWDIELVPVRTNVRDFDKPLNWLAAVTHAVIGLGHLLGRELARLYVPANLPYEDFPDGAMVSLPDGLLSSESLGIVGDGARLTRFDKTVAIGHIPAAYENLRICSAKIDGVMNCCRCGRCLNTMVALELAGTLQNFKTFPLPLDRRKLRVSALDYNVRSVFPPYLRGALAGRRYDLAFDLAVKLLFNHLRWGGKWLIGR